MNIQKEVDALITKVDIDHSGYIEYSGMFIYFNFLTRIYNGHYGCEESTNERKTESSF